MGFFKSVSDHVAAGASWVEKAGQAAVDTTVAAGKAAYDTSKKVAVYGYEKTKEAATWTKDKAVAGAEWTKDKAVAAKNWVKDKTVAAKNWAVKKAKKKLNDVVGKLAEKVGNAATKYKPVEKCLQDLLEKHDATRLSPEDEAKAKKQDGQFMDNNCPQSSPNPPKQGRLPKGCPAGANLPKVIYTNGINTSPEAACATMREIADTRCVQVIGVYNASFGMTRDVLDSKNNIDKTGREKSAHSQTRLMKEMLSKNPPERVTLYSHSQGGVITQEGLQEASTAMTNETIRDLKKQGMPQKQAQQEADRRTKEKMRNVNVHSFGTTETDWPPVGANYYQMTNDADPVPKLIHAVQKNRGTDTQPENLKERHHFEQNEWNPIGPHSMDKAYLPELNRIHPVPKKPNGGCC